MITKSPEETRELAKEFMRGLLVVEGPERFEGAMIIELIGDLGAGKTTFMSGVGEFLGVKQPIISPTFLIQRNYDIAEGHPWKKLVHLDAYRIENESELEGINWAEYSKDPDNIIFIEWPANMRTDLHPTYRIEFSHVSETEREIKF